MLLGGNCFMFFDKYLEFGYTAPWYVDYLAQVIHAKIVPPLKTLFS